jgi:ATP-dependent Clp protease ATP-binding subunit ClpC
LSTAASNALESAMSESIGLGHHYIGTEHVLLGLIAEADGQAGQVLRARGVDLRTARRAVSAALAGLSQRSRAQRAQPPASDLSSMVTAAVRREVQPLLARIERLERSDGTSQAAGRT